MRINVGRVLWKDRAMMANFVVLIVLSKTSAIIDTNFITLLFDSFLQFEDQYRRGLIKAVLFVLDISTDTR